MSYRILSWDWREQPDLHHLKEAIAELSRGGVQLHEVDTGSDQFAIVLADKALSDAHVRDLYGGWLRGDVRDAG